MSEYSLWLRDDALTQVGMVGSFDSFEMVLNHNDAGSWKLVCPRGSQAGEFLATDPNQSIGIILKRDGVTLGAGFVTRVENHFTPTDDTSTFYGSDDTALLGSRLCVPDPWWNEAADPLFVFSHDVRTGFADQVMAEYVDANMGPSAGETGHAAVGSPVALHPDRMLSGLVIPRTGGFSGVEGLGDAGGYLGPAGLGDSITYEARMINLLQVCQDIAVMGGGLRFRIINGPVTGQRSFVVDVPANRTDQVVFATELGTLVGINRAESIPQVNYAFVGGQGEEEFRRFIAAEDFASEANYGRWEHFVDQRQTADDAVLIAALFKALEDGSEELSFEIVPSDALRDSFGTDWTVGDRVTVLVDDVRIPAYISQVKLSVNDIGLVRVLPTVTTALLSKATRGALSVLNRRLSYLETSDGTWTPGTVIMWHRAIGDAPAGWAVCDTTLGTPDFTGRSPIGVGAVPGGGPTITLGGTFGAYAQPTHVHTGDVHQHTNPRSGNDFESHIQVASGTGTFISDKDHTHTLSDSDANTGSTNTGGTSGGNTLHPVVGIYFLKRVTL